MDAFVRVGRYLKNGRHRSHVRQRPLAVDQLEDRVAPAAMVAGENAVPLADSPVVEFFARLTDSQGAELRKDSSGRYILMPDATFLTEIYVDDLRAGSGAGGVFSAFTSLGASVSGVIEFGSIEFGAGFELAQSVDATSAQISSAGAVRESLAAPGGDPAQLLLTIETDVAAAVTNATTLVLDLESGESLPNRRNLLYGLEESAEATYRDVPVVVLSNPWINPQQSMDTNADGRVNPKDLLLLINARLRAGGDFEPGLPTGNSIYYLDVNGDGACTLTDFEEQIQYIRDLFS